MSLFGLVAHLAQRWNGWDILSFMTRSEGKIMGGICFCR